MSFASSGYSDIGKYKAACARYRNGANGKAAQRRYRKGLVGKAAGRRYRRGASGKMARIRYRNGENGAAAHRRDVAKWQKSNPNKVRAHRIVANAIKRGLMSRKPCVICGEKITHAHHVDYSKPYDVTWLCHVHHMNEHQMERQG